MHRDRGDAVRVVLATDGTAGDPDGVHAAADLAGIRRRESESACAVLGIDDLRFWGFPDNYEATQRDIDEVARRTCAELADFAPDVVYLPWHGEWHADHRALHWGVHCGLEQASFTGVALGYEVWSAMLPDVVVHVTSVVERKRRAIECFQSQLDYCNYVHPSFGIMAYRSMIHHQAAGYCEAFTRYGFQAR